MKPLQALSGQVGNIIFTVLMRSLAVKFYLFSSWPVWMYIVIISKKEFLFNWNMLKMIFLAKIFMVALIFDSESIYSLKNSPIKCLRKYSLYNFVYFDRAHLHIKCRFFLLRMDKTSHVKRVCLLRGGVHIKGVWLYSMKNAWISFLNKNCF